MRNCVERLNAVNRVSKYGEHYRKGEIQEALNTCRKWVKAHQLDGPLLRAMTTPKEIPSPTLQRGERVRVRGC